MLGRNRCQGKVRCLTRITPGWTPARVTGNGALKAIPEVTWAQGCRGPEVRDKLKEITTARMPWRRGHFLPRTVEVEDAPIATKTLRGNDQAAKGFVGRCLGHDGLVVWMRTVSYIAAGGMG